MNRFKNIETPSYKIEVTFSGIEDGKEYFHFQRSGCLIEKEHFDLNFDLEVYHKPQAKTSKMNSINIENLKIYTDDGEMKISGEEYETIHKKLCDSIEVIGTEY